MIFNLDMRFTRKQPHTSALQDILGFIFWVAVFGFGFGVLLASAAAVELAYKIGLLL